MTKTIELAKKSGMRNLSGIEKFAELVRADERQRLMAVAGEPYYPQWSHSNEFSAYTADQVAAAVLREREACANVSKGALNAVKSIDDFNNGWSSAAIQIEQAIRARGEG